MARDWGWRERLKVFLTEKAKIFESETELWIDGKEIVQLFLSISFILNRWKGNNNRNFIPNMNRLKEQNVWQQDYLYISVAMKITENWKTADNIIGNKTIDQT